MRALPAWLRTLLVIGLLWTLALPSTVLGQDAPPPEALEAMKSNGGMVVWLQLANVHFVWMDDKGESWSRLDDFGRGSWRFYETQTRTWPVRWEGDAFFVQIHDETVEGYPDTTLQGRLSADGSAVEWFHNLNTGEDYQTSFKAGPIPFVGMDYRPLTPFVSDTCAVYALVGAPMTAAVQEATAVYPDRRLTALDYQGYDGNPPELRVEFCWSTGEPAPEPAATPPSVGFWEFAGLDVYDPSNIDTNSPDYLSLVDENCEWGWGATVEEASAVTYFTNKFDCYGENAVEMEVSSTHTWTIPKRILVPGEVEPLAVAVVAVGPTAAPDHTRWSAKTELWYNIPSRNMVFDEGFLATAYYYEMDETHGSLPQSASVQWVVPGGAPGDTMTVQVSVEGISRNATVLLDYHYNYVTVDKTPIPGIEVIPDPIDEPPDPEGGPDDEPIDIDDLLAGFGGIGGIPGPETLAQALAGVVAPAVLIAILQAFSAMRGGPGSSSGDSTGPDGNGRGPDGGPLSGGPREMTLTDAQGRTFDYVWNPQTGGYINPQTGGMLDESLWAEYNQNLLENQRFIEEQREQVAVLTPPTKEQQYRSAQEVAERMIARLPVKHGDPLQQRLDAIRSRVTGQGIGSADVAEMREVTQEAWAHYRGRQQAVHKESVDYARTQDYWITGLTVVSTIGRVAGTIVEGSVGGSGFVTGFLYGAAENWDKGGGSMVTNGVISGAFNVIGTRLGSVNQTGLIWNAGTGGLSLAAETAITDYYNTGKVDLNNMKWSAGMGAAGGLFGAGVQRWLGGAPDMPPTKAGDLTLGDVPGLPGRRGDVDLPESSWLQKHVDAPVKPGAEVPVDIRRSGAAPDVPERSVHDPKLIPLHEQPPAVQRMAANVEAGPDGRPYAKLEDVLALQQSSTNMRSLKNAPAEVREAFNNTLQREVHRPHDAKLLRWIRNNVPEAKGRKVRVDDFRTPGAAANPHSINTDRDYRLLMTTEKGEIEIPKELWRDKSYEIFGDLTGFDARAVQRRHPEINWERMTPEQRLAKQHELHADDYQQMATDKYSIEASPDYSDQGRAGASRTQVEQNILAVKHGQARLQDPDAIGQMDFEKAHASLRRGNVPEAVAQAKKGVSSLRDVRAGYEQAGMDVGELPGNLQRAMDVIQQTPVDHNASPEAMAAMNEELARLDFPGGVEQVTQAISAQFSALKWARRYWPG